MSSQLVHCLSPGLRWGKGGPGTASEPEGEHQSTRGLETDEAENPLALWVCQQLKNCKEPPYTTTSGGVELSVGDLATEVSFYVALRQDQRHSRSGSDHRLTCWGPPVLQWGSPSRWEGEPALDGLWAPTPMSPTELVKDF